jgi:hypothetical protein
MADFQFKCSSFPMQIKGEIACAFKIAAILHMDAIVIQADDADEH